MSYHITHATEAQLPTLLHLAEQARNTMRSTGNTGQWVNGYPSREVFLDDIAHRASMIVSDDSGAIVGTFAFLPSPEPTYNHIDGQWLDDNSPYYVIHRIASYPSPSPTMCASTPTATTSSCATYCPNWDSPTAASSTSPTATNASPTNNQRDGSFDC